MFDFPQQLALQSWTLYGIGMVIITLRTSVPMCQLPSRILMLHCSFARWRRVRSFSRFAVDDWIMMTAIPVFYTGLIVCLNVIATGGGSNLFPPEQLATFTQAEINERIKGSKIVVASEQVRWRHLKHKHIIAQMANKSTVHAERNMVPESMHVIHVCSHADRNYHYEVDQGCSNMGRTRLDRRRDYFLHSLPTVRGLLGCTAA